MEELSSFSLARLVFMRSPILHKAQIVTNEERITNNEKQETVCYNAFFNIANVNLLMQISLSASS
jgi:hypothetical protein